MAADELSIIGPSALIDKPTTWMKNSIFTDLPPARDIRHQIWRANGGGQKPLQLLLQLLGQSLGLGEPA